MVFVTLHLDHCNSLSLQFGSIFLRFTLQAQDIWTFYNARPRYFDFYIARPRYFDFLSCETKIFYFLRCETEIFN